MTVCPITYDQALIRDFVAIHDFEPARSISELAREFRISSTAITNQITLLEKANLVRRTKRSKYHQIVIGHMLKAKINDLL